MRPSILLAAAPLLGLALPSPAAAAEGPRWTVQVDPLTAALGFAHVQVERRLHPRLSLYAGPSLRLYDGLLADVNGPYRGLGVEAGLRCFPWGQAPSGPWLMARGVLAGLSTTDGSNLRAVGGYGSVLAGYTAVLDGWLVLSGGLGGSYFAYQVGGYGPQGPAVAAHTAVGVAF